MTESNDSTLPWRVRYLCCGWEDRIRYFSTWDEADASREAYCSGIGVAKHGYSAARNDNGHQRAAIIERTVDR